MRKFSFRPALTLRGRASRGRGAGPASRCTHRSPTSPSAAYVLAAAFDVISFAGGDDQAWARDFYRAGIVRPHRRRRRVGVRRAHRLLGLADVDREGHPGPPHRQRPRLDDDHRDRSGRGRHRRARLADYWDEPATPGRRSSSPWSRPRSPFLGGTLGGTLAFDYGFNVETAGDHPVWHKSETDVFPGDKH